MNEMCEGAKFLRRALCQVMCQVKCQAKCRVLSRVLNHFRRADCTVDERSIAACIAPVELIQPMTGLETTRLTSTDFDAISAVLFGAIKRLVGALQ